MKQAPYIRPDDGSVGSFFVMSGRQVTIMPAWMVICFVAITNCVMQCPVA